MLINLPIFSPFFSMLIVACRRRATHATRANAAVTAQVRVLSKSPLVLQRRASLQHLVNPFFVNCIQAPCGNWYCTFIFAQSPPLPLPSVNDATINGFPPFPPLFSVVILPPRNALIQMPRVVLSLHQMRFVMHLSMASLD